MTPKAVIFDLDGTLAESKQPLTSDMATLLERLLTVTNVAIISGGALSQFLKQVVARLPEETNLASLYLLPTSGAALYEYRDDEWQKVYEEQLSEKEAQTIDAAIRAAAEETGIIDFSEPAWGERIEHRGGQVTLSALGQQAPLALKKDWDVDHAKRRALQERIAAQFPEFSVRIGGTTSIDITKNGIDKAYGLRKLCERLGIKESETLYVGDELGPGGNDEAVYKTETKTQSVKSLVETERIIEKIIAA